MLFDVSIMAVTMDLAEHHMFCGGSDGSIFQVDLCTWVSGRGGRGCARLGAEMQLCPVLTGPPASAARAEREELPAGAGPREGVQRAQVQGWGRPGGGGGVTVPPSPGRQVTCLSPGTR